MHKIFALLTGETFVLIAALLLFAYVRKNDIGKWLQYMAAGLAIFIMVLMIGSVFTCCMPCYRMGGGHGGYNMGGHGGCSQIDMGNCKMGGNSGCEMGNMSCPKEGMNEDCCMKGGMEKNCEMEVTIDGDGKDTMSKKVIIKKTR